MAVISSHVSDPNSAGCATGQEPPAERDQSRSGSGSPATSNNTNSGGSGLQLPPSLSPSAAQAPLLGGQLNSADLGHNGAAVHRGSLQHAVGGSLPHGDGRGDGGAASKCCTGRLLVSL